MAAAKGTSDVTGERNPLRTVLFILSIGLCLLSVYLILDFQSSAQSKLSGELILGQVDSASYNNKDAPILGFFFEYFGILTYLFAFMIIYLGYFLVLKPIDIWHADFYRACLRILGFNCTLLGLSGVLSRYFDIGYTGAGGLLGDMLNMFCDLAIPSILSVFIFAIAVFCGLSMLFGHSPFFIFDKVGDLFFKVLPAKSDNTNKKHKTHHSLSQDDNDNLVSLPDGSDNGLLKGAMGATMAASGVLAASQAQGASLDNTNLPQYEPTVDDNLAEPAYRTDETQSLDNLEPLNNQVNTQTEDQGLDDELDRGEFANAANMQNNDAQPDFFAQVLNSEYGHMSPNDQAIASQELNNVNNNQEPFDLEPSLPELTEDDYTSQTRFNELDQANLDNPYDIASAQNQNIPDQVLPEPDESEGFISSNNQAAQQIFAHEMQSEDESQFNNDMALLQEQNALSQVPPMPTLNVSEDLNQDSQAMAQPEALADNCPQEPMINQAQEMEFINNEPQVEPDPFYDNNQFYDQEASNSFVPSLDGNYSQDSFDEQRQDNLSNISPNEPDNDLEPKIDNMPAQEQVLPELKSNEEPALDNSAINTRIISNVSDANNSNIPQGALGEEVGQVASVASLAAVATAPQAALDSVTEVAQHTAQELLDAAVNSTKTEPNHELDSSANVDDSAKSEDDRQPNNDSGAVHTIVQRTDPKVIAAQIAAKNKEKEERERKLKEEQERKEREERERKEREALERKRQEEQERKEREALELKAKEEARRLEHENVINNHDQNHEDDEYEYVYEDDEEAPLYAGTYAARMAREKAAQNGQPTAQRRLKKIKRDTGEEVIDLAEPNTHDIGVNLPLEERPRTIIRDSRNDGEDVAPKGSNYYPSVDASGKASLGNNLDPQEEALNSQESNEGIDDGEPNVDPEQSHTHKNELIKTLSSLASEMDDAHLQHFNDQDEVASPDLTKQTFNFEQSSLDKETVHEEDEDSHVGSTNIQVGSGTPDSDSQKFNQANISTNITRSNSINENLAQDSEFLRFATTRDNEIQSQNRSLGGVDVNLFDDDYDKPYVPNHVYDFGGKEVGQIDESLSGLDEGSDDEFVTGAAIEDKSLSGNGGFDFARFVTDSDSKETNNSAEEHHQKEDKEDNIISFNKFDDHKKSYEVDDLSSAFIPIEGDEKNSLSGRSLFGDRDYVHDSYENNVKSEENNSVLDDIESDDIVQSEDNSDEHDEQYNDQYNDQDEQYTDEQYVNNNNSFDANMMASQMEAFNNAQMMNNQAMYNQMANQMPNGQQVQYMQMPNGQYVPVMPNAMNNMAPNMMYPNMATPNMAMGQVQYMQMPNGQYVPVMPNAMNNMAPNMMYQNMATPNMGMVGNMPNMPMANNQSANMMNGYTEESSTANVDAHSMGEHGPSGVGLPTAGNAFMGAHNSSSSNLPSYMAGVSQGGATTNQTERSSLALCSVPRHRYDNWRPGLDLLARSNSHVDISLEELDKTSERINEVLHSFGIKATVADYLTGPVITRFDLDLAPGVKSSAISSIETELCRNLMVPNVRVVPIVEGSSYVGLEVPNPQRQFITLADMASSREFQEAKSSLPMCLGASVVGAPVVKDLADCPHLLVAGTTGSGKSAGLNTMLISLLLKRSPSELRLILVDPKQLEFSIYKDLPHLITPVITDVAEKTPIALRWCVDEMERRFKLMSMLGVRKLSEYNDLIKSKAALGQSIPDPLWNKELSPNPQALEPLPWIVVVVEEFADLMAQSSRKKDKEGTPDGLIARLSAKSRAAGIHLVLVTQTPRSEVVTGMIKANFPSRVAFTVQNRLDSTIVLDEKGAECLLGNGDMLYKFPGEGTATRAHGAFTSNDDVKAVVDAWKNYAGAPEYLEDVVAVQEEEVEEPSDNKAKELDVKFDQAVEVVREYMDRRNKPPTVTDLQTELGVGYPRAKKIFLQLSREGIID